jgi:glycosyltransferase involved in cell wall biosynthesis
MMVGRVPPESMPSVYSHAQALLISLEARPLFSQTIPSKMQTYLSLGIPILGMINGEGADLIRRSGAGLCCDAGDSVALANLAIEMSKLNVEKLREFGANAVQAHDNEFERDMLLSKLCQLMEEVIDNSR